MQFIDPLLLVMIGWLLKSTLQMATPLVLTALGGMYSERSGIVNIGLEGMMLIGAFAAVAGSYFTDNPWFGILVAIVAGGALAGAHAIVCVKFKGDHIVSGTGVILFAGGFTTLMLEVIWGQRGTSDEVARVPQVFIPGIQDIPIIGTIFTSLSPLVYVMFIAVIVSWYVMYHTPFGLRLRAAGEDPSTLDTAGVNVERIRIIGVLLSGCLAGLGGAYLAIGFGARFGKAMISGRGFIALAALIFGNWNPKGILGAGLFFGFLDGLRIFINIYFPELIMYSQFIQMVPYVLVIVALAGIRKSVPPKGIAIPYEKEKRV